MKFFEKMRLKKRAKVLTARLDAIWERAELRRDGEFGTVINTDKWRDTRDFFKSDERTNYDAWAAEHFEISKKLGIESPHFDIRRQGGDALNPDSPKALVTTDDYHPSVVTYKEEDGFFVMYRDGARDPDVDPVPVEEWDSVVVDVDEAEFFKAPIRHTPTPRKSKYPV